LKQVGAGDSAEISRKIVKRNYGELAVLFECKCALGQPCRATSQIEIAAHQAIGKLRKIHQERTVQKTAGVECQEIFTQLRVSFGDILRKLRDRDVTF